MRGDKRFVTADVSKKLGVARLSFGNAEKLSDLLHLKAGAVSPLGLMFDTDRQITLLIDQDLLNMEKLCFHPCISTQTLAMKTKDFTGVFLKHTGHIPIELVI